MTTKITRSDSSSLKTGLKEKPSEKQCTILRCNKPVIGQ